ncbi:hypothetical protein FIBSPDRAFT_925095 [Athelia psychrophila]|uniref:Uncharacterized protein n=1 Tax=Athelia psychrophila TaxID=1759441 RepID=A0A166VDA1_9AGAM|nr:hypothetical protein FIBSPDRAFT_925095 [Fibularhizoctonia sp. CBS 109695]
MLIQNGLQAWLEDQDGIEIKHEDISCEQPNDISAIFPVDAEQPYTVHWSTRQGSIPGSYWNELSIFRSENRNRFEKIATHWMEKNDHTTQSRDSRRLQGRFKVGLITPFDELSLKEQEVADHALRLTFREATFSSAKPIIADVDGYCTPEYKLSNNSISGVRALQTTSQPGGVALGNDAWGKKHPKPRQDREDVESMLTKPLSSREPALYDPGREASAVPLAVSQIHVMSQKALEASEMDLSTVEIESKELHQIANLVSRVKKNKMHVQRVKVS